MDIREYRASLLPNHSTGHASRLARPSVVNRKELSGADYSKEELVAEMGAAFVCGHCGIESATVDNSAAYIRSWLRTLQNDTRLVIHAATQAQQAMDFILDRWDVHEP